MTKQDYEKIAKVLNYRRKGCVDVIEQLALDLVVMDLNSVFTIDNPKFDSKRFLNAVYEDITGPRFPRQRQ